MPKVTLLSKDLAKMALAKAGKTVFTLKPMPVEVAIEIDKDLEGALEEDPLLQQQMVDKAQKKLEAVAVSLGGELKKIDDEIEKKPGEAEELVEKAKKAVEEAAKDAEKDLPAEVMKTWEKLKSRKAEYKKYKIKAGVKLVTSGGMLTASITTTAIAGWTGAGTVLGIIGIIKSASGIAQQIKQLGKEAEEVQKELDDMINEVAQRYKDSGATETGLKELGTKALEVLTSFKVNSISKCKEWDESLSGKVNGVEIEAHALAKKINPSLSGIDKVAKDLEAFFEKMNKAQSDEFAKLAKKAKALLVKMYQLRDGLMKTIEACQATAVRAKTARKTAKELHAKVELLDQDVPQWSKVLQKATPLLDLAMCTELSDVYQSLVGIALDVGQDTETFDKLVDKVCD